MEKENVSIISNKKVFCIRNIRYIFPYEISHQLENWGELEHYRDKKYTLEEINKIVADLIVKQPYIEGSMRLEINVYWSVDNLSGYHHMLTINNYFFEIENKNEQLTLKYRIN